jgi:hypothetical protein
LLLACQQPADEGGKTRVVDGAGIISTLAGQSPVALRALSAPRAAFFGAAGVHLGAVLEPAGPARTRIRLRLDDLAWFSADAADPVALLRTVIACHTQTFRLREGEGLLFSNTRWLHGRDSFTGRRIMLRILGDPCQAPRSCPAFPHQRQKRKPRRVSHKPPGTTGGVMTTGGPGKTTGAHPKVVTVVAVLKIIQDGREACRLPHTPGDDLLALVDLPRISGDLAP